jgi:hypothetical protein
MNRTKWMRLSVRDLGDVLRWAGAQNARDIGEFRYRVVNGREIVSFRLEPRYAIDVGAREIIVVAHVRMLGWRARLRDLWRIAVARARRLPHRSRAGSTLRPSAASLPAHRPVRLQPPAAAPSRAQPRQR